MQVYEICHFTLEGLGWRVGLGEKISINEDVWIPGADDYRLTNIVHSMHNCQVVDLIDANTRTWKRDLIVNTFLEVDADRILQIPLATTKLDDLLVWKGESSGEFLVCNAYKLLQNFSGSPCAYALRAN